jgi:hypothetical protein
MPLDKTVSPLRTALLLTLGLRLGYSLIGAIITPYLNLSPALIRSNDLTGNLMTREAGGLYRWLGVWERFDTLWYIHIAQHGYDRPDAIVFFPLYPLLIRACSFVLREPLAASLLISTVAAFFLFWGFQKLLALDLPPTQVQRALLLYAVWPASFCFFAGYPDALVTALLIWAVYAARGNRWLWAGVLGFFAALAKAVGVLVIVPLAIIAWRQKPGWRAWLPMGLPLLAALLFAFYLRLSGHQGAATAYAQFWQTAVAWPWETLWASTRQLSAVSDPLLAFNWLMFFLIFIPVCLRWLRVEYLVYTLAALLFFLTKKTDPLLQSTTRYALAVFPAFASWSLLLKRDWALALAVVTAFLFNLILLWAFFDWALLV